MERAKVNNYFTALREVLNEVHPECIWNMDECGFYFEHTPSKILVQKGERNVNARVSSSRQNTTVVACANAAGRIMPPFIIVKVRPGSLSMHIRPLGTVLS